MQKEKIELLTKDGRKLDVQIFRNKTDRVILMVPGIIPYGKLPYMSEIYKIYYDLGNSICDFDFLWQKAKVRQNVYNLDDAAEQIGTIITYLHRQYKHITVISVSFNTVPTVIAVSRYEEFVDQLILVNGVYFFDKLLPLFTKIYIGLNLLIFRNLRNQKKFVSDYFRPEDIHIPTMIVASEKDQIVNPKQSQIIYEKFKTKKKQLVNIPNGNHQLNKEEFMKDMKPLLNWISPHKNE